MNCLKLEISMFMFCLFAQNFALVKTENFGIAALTIFLVFIFIKYRLINKLNYFFIMFIILFLIFALSSAWYNNIIDLVRIIRWIMIFFIVFTTYNYIKILYRNNSQKHFWEIFFKFIIVINIYGIYEYVANLYKLPLFLNVFNDNPSYATRGMFDYYGGWINYPRIYTMFFEPSSYATFLATCMIIVVSSKYISFKKRVILEILLLTNLIMTFSRAGLAIIIYTYLGFTLFKIIKRMGLKNVLYPLLSKIILLIPLINIYLMYIANKYVFQDLSSKGRTSSSIYYLQNSFNNISDIILGHGIASISHNYTLYLKARFGVEAFAHNGYVEFIYELGWIMFLFILGLIYYSIRNINNYTNRILVLSFISSVACFGAVYQVETLIAIIIMLYCYYKFELQTFQKSKRFNN